MSAKATVFLLTYAETIEAVHLKSSISTSEFGASTDRKSLDFRKKKSRHIVVVFEQTISDTEASKL